MGHRLARPAARRPSPLIIPSDRERSHDHASPLSRPRHGTERERASEREDAGAAPRRACGTHDRSSVRRRLAVALASVSRASAAAVRRLDACLADDLVGPRRGEPVSVPAGLPTAPPIDPVASPDAYRRELLAWLGEDDPAAVQAATVARVREIVPSRRRPAPRATGAARVVGDRMHRPSRRFGARRERADALDPRRGRARHRRLRPGPLGRRRSAIATTTRTTSSRCSTRSATRTCGCGRRRRRPTASASGGTANAGRRATGSWSSWPPATTDSTSPRPSGRSRRSAAALIRSDDGLARVRVAARDARDRGDRCRAERGRAGVDRA